MSKITDWIMDRVLDMLNMSFLDSIDWDSLEDEEIL
jgi:hypothetical protein